MNNSRLVPRKIKKEDWSTLEKWWNSWPNSSAPPKESLPGNGTGGIIIEDNGKPVIAGFIYQTNSKLAMLEGIISNPNYRGKQKRDKSLEILVACLHETIKLMGCKYIFAMTDNKKIINLGIKLGWCLDAKPNYTLTKIL
jgi:hypothetical protein|tara:strand:- start:3498 stop:3917 length:420 start_codon:yes stop_codon:yes gene_type:complete